MLKRSQFYQTVNVQEFHEVLILFGFRYERLLPLDFLFISQYAHSLYYYHTISNNDKASSEPLASKNRPPIQD